MYFNLLFWLYVTFTGLSHHERSKVATDPQSIGTFSFDGYYAATASDKNITAALDPATAWSIRMKVDLNNSVTSFSKGTKSSVQSKNCLPHTQLNTGHRPDLLLLSDHWDDWNLWKPQMIDWIEDLRYAVWARLSMSLLTFPCVYSQLLTLITDALSALSRLSSQDAKRLAAKDPQQARASECCSHSSPLTSDHWAGPLLTAPLSLFVCVCCVGLRY